MMTNCIWLLLSSHGVLVLVLNIILILVPVVCILLSFLIVISIRLQASQQANSSNEADDQISMCLFQFFKICTPVMFAITTSAYFVNYIFHLHVDNPIDEHWVTNLENACKSNTQLQTITALTSVGVTAVLQFSLYALALFYYFRIVIIFEHSAYAVPKRFRKTIGICVIILFFIIVTLIPIRFFFSRSILVFALAVMLLLFVGFSVTFQTFLIKQMKNIVSTQSTANIHVQRTFSTLVRMTVLFAISTGSTVVQFVFFAASVTTGLYAKFAEVKSVVTLGAQLDMLVNLVCIGLQFTFAERFYACMCTICHNRFQNKYKLDQAMYSSSTTTTATTETVTTTISLHTNQSTINAQNRTMEIEIEIDE